jgi:hypothetical protein
MQELSLATQIQIEQAEMGELPNDNWDNYPWVDQITYTTLDPVDPAFDAEERQIFFEQELRGHELMEPYTVQEMAEASEMFGELQDDQDIEEFEEWIESITSTRYFQIRSAIEVIRSALTDYQSDLDMTRLLRAIHPA